MKRTDLCKLSALMLVLALLLCSCGGTGGKPYDPEKPVEVEPLLENFITEQEITTQKYNTVEMLDEYGKVIDNTDDYVVFLEETKDFLNNLTETYRVYSFEAGEVVLTLSNTYADEFDGRDEFGNRYRPPVTLEVKVVEVNSINIIVASYVTYTRIADELIEEENLNYSYYESYLTKFYAADGEFIAESGTCKQPTVCGSSRRYVAISFGRDVVMFEKSTGDIIETFNGDTERVAVPDVITDKYNYFLGNIGNSNNLARLDVYTKDNNLVVSYSYSNDPTVSEYASVLDNGDILIQNVAVTESVDAVYFGGTPVKINTFVLDVESGKLTSYDCEYFFFGSVLNREDVLKEGDGSVLPSENVRNYAQGIKIEAGKDLYDSKYATVFFDNLLNINLVIEDTVNGEAEGVMPGEPLKDGYRLIEPVSGVSKYAVINKDGDLVCYVPDGAFVATDRIVTESAVYTLEMELIRELDTSWKSGYDNVTAVGVVGNFMIYNITDTYYSNNVEEQKNHVQTVYIGDIVEEDCEGGEYYYESYHSNCIAGIVSDGVAILRPTDGSVYKVMNGNGQVIVYVLADSELTVANDNTDCVYIYYDYLNERHCMKLFVEEEIGGDEE